MSRLFDDVPGFLAALQKAEIATALVTKLVDEDAAGEARGRWSRVSVRRGGHLRVDRRCEAGRRQL
jgi:hypothetical protein